LRKILRVFDIVYIVLDALDELKEREGLFSFIRYLSLLGGSSIGSSGW
jgi:hypothetical protein